MTLDSPGDTSSQVPQAQHIQNQLGSGPQALSMAKVVQGNSVAGPPNMRNFAKIMEDEKTQRNDQGRRILVLHSGQDQQCSNCLGQSSHCPANGNGKLCTEMKTPRAKMSSYMNGLKISVGYSSLKSQYLAAQARQNPALGGLAQDIDS